MKFQYFLPNNNIEMRNKITSLVFSSKKVLVEENW